MSATTAEFDYCVVIGRFQPFHNGHLELIKKALTLASKRVIIVLGTVNKAPNIQNPFTVDQRMDMVADCFDEETLCRLSFVEARDYWYVHNRWITEVQREVRNITGDNSKICNIGEVSYFPQWEFFESPETDHVHATTVRGLYFTHDKSYKEHVPPTVYNYLEEFKTTKEFKNLKQEYDFIREYRSSWEGAPFPPTFVTVDAVVICSGHVLVVERGGNPGKGLIALPGGFVNNKESIQAAAYRELKEETGLTAPPYTLKDVKIFDYPERSLRGRTITHAHLFDLGCTELPNVVGSDDAAKSWWMPLDDLGRNEHKFYEDHYHIITSFVYKY